MYGTNYRVVNNVSGLILAEFTYRDEAVDYLILRNLGHLGALVIKEVSGWH
jgi:hypothetical protein